MDDAILLVNYKTNMILKDMIFISPRAVDEHGDLQYSVEDIRKVISTPCILARSRSEVGGL